MHDFDTIIIGGGPSGMMAAGRAGERGLRVLLLEKNPGLGKKLLISGGGRCNLTNNKQDVRIMLEQYKGSSKFLFSAFTQFGVTESLNFFHEQDCMTKEENEGRMFPTSNKSQSVLDALIAYMKASAVTIKTNSAVTSISKTDDGFDIHLTNNEVVTTKSCIVATGGISHPETGSTGEGYKWLKKLGHNIVENDLALVPLTLSNDWIPNVAGVTLTDIKISVYKNNKKQFHKKGKLLFTHVGVSGPTVLNMSKAIAELLNQDEGDAYSNEEPQKVTIKLDLFPDFEINQMRTKLHELFQEHSNKAIKNTLPLLIAPKLASVLLQLTNINSETPCHSVRSDDRKQLVTFMKELTLHVDGLVGKDKAVISSGGIPLTEVDFKTMQSRKIPGLFITGDMLNIDRPSGGYSLQLCWTTGYVAGDNC